ncbi:hypothetical protein KC361_g102 [Hortaea werneckii]|nr:hypothetical protein KC361_g102 [Hortaea werneckii]
MSQKYIPSQRRQILGLSVLAEILQIETTLGLRSDRSIINTFPVNLLQAVPVHLEPHDHSLLTARRENSL